MRQSRCGQDGDASPAIAGRYMSSATPAALDSSVVTSRLTPSSTSASSASGAGRARRSRSPSDLRQRRLAVTGNRDHVSAELRRKSLWRAGHPSSEDESSRARSQLSWGQSLAIAIQDETHVLARGDQPGARASPGAKEKAMIRSLTRLEAPNRLRMLLAVSAVAAAAAVLAACGSSGTSSAGGGSGGTDTGSPVATTGGSSLKTATIGGATVLTSSKGFTPTARPRPPSTGTRSTPS